MDTIIKLFGEGKDLSVMQMSLRAIVIYFITLILIRISGRRTFGKKSAFDNTIVIILGAILSRAVVGASPFLSTVVCSLALVVLHRLLAWLCITNDGLARMLRGKPLLLFSDNKFDEDNMSAGLISKKELMGDIRLKANDDKLDNVDQIYLETSGEISVVKKSSH